MGIFSVVMRPCGIISAHFVPCFISVLLFHCLSLLLCPSGKKSSYSSLEVRLEMLGDFAVVLAKDSVMRDLEKPHSTENTATDFLRKLWGIIKQNLVHILQNESLMHNCILLPFRSIYSKLPSV